MAPGSLSGHGASNFYGQLGDSTLDNHAAAVQVQESFLGSPLTGVAAIAAGGGHSLALLSGGTVSSWGYNGRGQLGFRNISTMNRMFPGPVVDKSNNTLAPVTAVAAGGSHSLFLKNDGTVWACGFNSSGQIGDGTTDNQTHGVVQVLSQKGDLTAAPPVAEVVLSNITAIAAGLDHSLALDGNGNVWAWGFNFYGQVGNGQPQSLTPVTKPVQVKQDTNGTVLGSTSAIVAIRAIGNTSYAVDANGDLWVWGATPSARWEMVRPPMPTLPSKFRGALPVAVTAVEVSILRKCPCFFTGEWLCRSPF